MAQTLNADIAFSVKLRDNTNNNLLTQLVLKVLRASYDVENSSGSHFIAGGVVDSPIPFGSVKRAYLLAMNLSVKVGVRFLVSDTVQQMGPGLVILESSVEGFVSFFITTPAGTDVCIEYIVAGAQTT